MPVDSYIDELDEALDELTEAKFFKPYSWGAELVSDFISNIAKEKLKKSLRNTEGTRFNKSFAEREEVINRLKTFYSASYIEFNQLNSKHNYNFKDQPRKMIYGHTHLPVKWSGINPVSHIVENHKSLHMYNCGGWLLKKTGDNPAEFPGAEVFVYESESGFSSHSIN